jgi:hypothetical protein
MLLKKNKGKQVPLLEKIKALENKSSIIKFLIVLTVLFVFYNVPKKYLGDTYPICLYRLIIGKRCFGCGTTRAIWSILHFKINEAIEYNKLIIITFPLLVGCTTSWINKGNEMVPKSVILSPALAVSQAKALRNRVFQGCSSKI